MSVSDRICLTCRQPASAHTGFSCPEPASQSTDAQETHCRDCCCARAWKALGITEYTGLSIPEHIELLRNQLAAELKWRKDHSNE